MRVTEDSTNTLRHSVCKAAVGAEQACTAEFFRVGARGSRSRGAGSAGWRWGRTRTRAQVFLDVVAGGGQPRARHNKLVAHYDRMGAR